MIIEGHPGVSIDLPAAGSTAIELDGPLAVRVNGESDGGEQAVVVNGFRVDFAPTSLLVLDGEFMAPSFDMMNRVRIAIALLVEEVNRLRAEIEALKAGGAQS